MKTVNTKNSEAVTESDIHILKVGSCESVSRKSTLTYHIGCTTDGEIQLRVYANTAAGFFSKEWLPLKAIDQMLIKAGSHFTSFALQPLFRGKSQNNTAFLLAVLLREGLVGRAVDKKRYYEKLDAGHFITEIKSLIDSNADEKPTKATTNAVDKPSKSAKPITNAVDKPSKPAKKKAISDTSNKATSDKESSDKISPP
jgi:hypothetical protein